MEELYHAALERAPADRAAFLAQACGTDLDLRREVESLLGEETSRTGMLDHPAALLPPDANQLTAGSRLGPYTIEASMGKGGMGEVWKARDTRLNRAVAIKRSAEQFTNRFEREARAVAALNHPNICHLYDIGPNYLVMELVEGPTLAERMKRGPIPLEEALGIAKQIADALEAAHEKGIIHRDLKPANIKIRSDGSVKVLDFGLAKAVGREAVVDSDASIMTTPGMIMGTPGYMPPEQARGEKVDKRADIWAFGVVLYEMVTAKRLFDGATVSDSLAATLTKEPDLTLAPEQARRLLSRCLKKDPAKRLRDISGVELLLDTEAATTVSARSRPGMTGWVAAGLFALIAAGLAFLYFRPKPSMETHIVRSEISPPEKTSFAPTPPAISPDGRKLVFSAQSADGKTQLWLRSLDSITAQPLAGTDSGQAAFWSPDSKSIGFFANGKLKRIDAAGGPVLTLADAKTPTLGGTWNADGTIVFASGTSPLRKVSASGGGGVRVTKNDAAKENSQRWPWFLPDGRHFLFLGVISGVGHGSIRIGSLDSPGVQTVMEADSRAIYAQGHLLFLRGSTLMAQPFDTRTLKLTGEAAPVVEQVQSSSEYAAFSVSNSGELVYVGGVASGRQLTWFDRSGKRIGSLGEPADMIRPSFSPDRKSLTVSITDPSSHNSDIWIYDVARGLRTRFTFDPAAEIEPIWSPDGETIVFDSNRKGPSDLYRKKANGAGNEELLYADRLVKRPTSLSADGRFLLYFTTNDPKTAYDVWVLPDPLGPPGASKPYPFQRTQFEERNAQFSPDGKWVAYESDESGREEIYATPFPGPGGKQQISTGGGRYARWRSDGKEIFYTTLAGRLTAVEITEKGDTLEAGGITPLFGALGIGQGYPYDVSADGQRFLVLVPPEQSNSGTLTVVQNWTVGLKN